MKTRALLPSLLLLLFLFSPKILGPIRLGDIAVLFLIPFISMAKPSKGEKTFALLLLVAALTTLWSFASGTNTRGLASALTLARLLELAVLYRFSMNANPGILKITSVFAVAILFIYGAYEFADIRIFGGEAFDRCFNSGWFEGESNHVAGAVVILTALFPQIAFAALGVVAFSGSRMALVALVAVVSRTFIIERRYREMLLFMLMILIVATFMSPISLARWTNPLPTAPYAGPHVDRAHAWNVAIDEAPPLTGVGLGARPSSVYESCYVLLYAETGAAGILTFLALLGVTTAAFPALGIALTILSFTMNSLLIAKIAGPAAILLGAIKTPDTKEVSSNVGIPTHHRGKSVDI